MYLIYSVLYFVVLLFLLPYEYLKRPKDIRPRWLRERMGFISPSPDKDPSPLVWVHAVSVGEVISAVPFIKELRKRYPFISVVLSTVTDTGQKVAGEKAADIARIIYLPFDLAHIVKRVLKRIRPSLFIAVETELWPNIFRIFNNEGIRLLVMNGRLSDNSFSGYRKIKFFIRDVLSRVDLFCMQDRVYAERIRELGVDKDRVKVTGNFKFDTRPPETLPEWTGSLGHPVVLAGSTHEGEEELMVSVFGRLKSDLPEMNLLLAPRHPERFRKIEEMIRERGLPFLKRSGLSAANFPAGKVSGMIVLLDTIGELASAYGIADIAVMGGSFVKVGGHNPLEPAFWGKPVVCGPHMENFPFIQDFYIGSGAIKTDDDGLYDVLKELLRSPAKRKAMGERARTLYREKAGAVGRAVEVLEGYLKPHLPLTKEESLP
jgi:3-deoxy-D-manno-octulosonic-acid transferase